MATNNLPVQPTPFVGRDSELAQIVRLLADPRCKLLTLVGPGGIGKTRLALEAARAIVENRSTSLFPDGVYYVTLQALDSPDFIISTIAEAVSCQFYPGSDSKHQLLDHLREKVLLLILDNLEHLLESASLVSDILGHATGVKVLATSRERLNLLEEWVLEVVGLNVPASAADTEVEGYSAIQLFVQNASRTHVGFKLTNSQQAAVVRICQMVDGMPLGIEMASAWVRVLSCEQIATELARSLDILEMPTRNVPPRHRNIRAAFEPTWQRLSEIERDVFQKLSVFRGGFTPDAARAVTGASLRTLSSLVDKSLLRVDHTGRYDLHELLRQYGEEQLNHSLVETERVHDQHCAFYAEFVRQQWEAIIGPQMKEALDAIGAELENVQAGWAWAASHVRRDELWKLISGLQQFFWNRKRFQDGIISYAQAANRIQAVTSRQDDTALLGCILANHAYFCGDAGLKEYLDDRYRTSDESHRTSLALLRRLDDLGARRETVEALTMLGWTSREVRPLEGQRLCQESIAFARSRGYRRELEWALIVLASIDLWTLDDYVEGKQASEEALELARQFEHPLGIACCCWFLGQIAYSEGHYLEAKRLQSESYRLLKDLDSRATIVTSLRYLGEIAVAQGDFVEARRLYREDLVRSREGGFPRSIQIPLVRLADLLAREGDKERAVELIALALGQPDYIPFNPKGSAIQILQRLEADLQPDVFAAAVARGKARKLDETVSELLAELSQPHLVTGSSTSTQAASDLLTAREVEILRLVANGLSNREIAEALVIAVGTVKWYVSQICSKLQAKNRTQAITHARELNLLN